MQSRRDFLAGTIPFLGAFAMTHPARAHQSDDEAARSARRFIDAHEEKVRPLERSAARAWWDANISGSDQDFAAKEAKGRRTPPPAETLRSRSARSDL